MTAACSLLATRPTSILAADTMRRATTVGTPTCDAAATQAQHTQGCSLAYYQAAAYYQAMGSDMAMRRATSVRTPACGPHRAQHSTGLPAKLHYMRYAEPPASRCIGVAMRRATVGTHAPRVAQHRVAGGSTFALRLACDCV